MTTSIRQAQKGSYVLVKFSYVDTAGTATHHRYTDWSSDVESDEMLGGFTTWTFVSNPQMTVSPVKIVGTLEEQEFSIEMTQDTFLERLSDGTPHAPTYVKVFEIIDSDDAASVTQTMLFRGRVSATKRNFGGKSERVLVECTTWRTRLTAALGMPANHHCVNIFGDNSNETGSAGTQCRIDVSLLRSAGTATAISGKRLTVTGVTTPAGTANDRYWHRGWIEYDGTRILVRDYDRLVSTTYFYLQNFPPTYWIGKTVRLVPGCDLTIGTCRDRWSNEDNFNGFGFAIPSRNPTYEKA